MANLGIIEQFVTLPFTSKLKAECDIYFLNGELEACIHFIYDKIKVPAAFSQLKAKDIESFITKQGILARNLAEEQQIIERLFQDFVYDSRQGVFSIKSEKKIVEFMTEVVPQNKDRVKFNCPENLLDLFVFDDTTFKLSLKESDRIDVYIADLVTNGPLKGVSVEHLWDCLASKRPYIELAARKEASGNKKKKILVINLEKIAPVVQIFDELGISKLDDHKEERPLWSLASVNNAQFKGLPIKFSMSSKLEDIQKQMLGDKPYVSKKIPKDIKATLRKYQKEGAGWLDRLRSMHLNGILADDMGLGKTLQAIITLSQVKEENPKALSIVVCPTSLVYNWQEEFHKFNNKLKVLPVDGTPVQRKKLIKDIAKYDVLIT